MKLRFALLRPEYVAVLSALLLALILRVWGISFGLPYRYHPDEPQHVAEAAQMLAEKRLEPEIFNNPPFYKYVLMVADIGFLAGTLLLGDSDSIVDLADRLRADPSPLYLLGRVISAVAGTLTVGVTYLLGRTAYNRRVGLLAAIFLAVAFLHVRDSHYAVNDALLGLLTTLSLLGAVLVAQRGRTGDYILAASAAGLAFATKYTAIFTVVTLMVAHFFSPGVRFSSLAGLKLKRLIGAGFLVLIAAILGSPYFLLDPGKVLNDVSSSIYSYGKFGFEGWQLDPAGGYLFYLKSLWWGLGPGLLLLAALGLIFALVRHSKEDVLLVFFPLLLYLFMGRQQMYFVRFILPAIPAMLVLAALAAQILAGYAAGKISLPGAAAPAPVIIVLITMIVILTPTMASIRYDYLLTLKDTRTLAKEWIETNIAEGVKIAVDWPHHSPPLSTADDPEPNSSRSYDMFVVGGNGLADYPIEYYQANGFQYLVASSNIYNIPLADKAQDDRRRIFYAHLNDEFELIGEIRPYGSGIEAPFIFDQVTGPAIDLWQRERPGPTIRVYALTPTLDSMLGDMNAQ